MHVVLIILLVLFLAALIYGPSIWVKRVLRKYQSPDDLFPGTGAELAGHLLKALRINNVVVEQIDAGDDHYDPENRAVRLSPDNFNGKSLTAITVAAHEVGHAMQHAYGYPMFQLRHHLVHIASVTEKIGSVAIMAIPLIVLLTRSPAASGVIFLLGLGGIFFATLVHLITLPVELDASFRRALPLLEEGKYLDASQSWHARKILKAAAFTYVAGSLASLLNFYRWITILRR